MSTELRNVPGCEAQNKLSQTRFWGGKNRLTCLQVTNRNGDFLQLDKFQARALAVELMLFAEDREVEEFEDCGGDERHTVDAGGRAVLGGTLVAKFNIAASNPGTG